MGRPPSNGGPSFRFSAVEVGEMDAILQAHNYAVPTKELLDALAQRFSASTERAGKMEVSPKQVWNWFQNRRYALRARAAKDPVPGQGNVSPMPQHDQPVVRNVSPVPQPQPQAAVRNAPQAPQPQPAPPNTVKSVPQVIHPLPAPSVQNAQRNASDDSQMEFEAKSARDGAWYDVTAFLSHRSLETANPEALVRFAGFGAEEDEWVNIRRHVRQRSFPCESLECVAVLPGDLILCFQEGKEQALYFDAHVLDAQRRRHDVRGCRCRFLVRYDHDQAEEIVQLRKICRRPETFYRLEQLQALSKNGNQEKTGIDPQAGNSLKANASGATIRKQAKPEELIDSRNMTRGAPANFTAAIEFSGTPANATATSAYGGTPANAIATSAYGGAPTNATATSTYGGAPTNATATSAYGGTPANITATSESAGAPANVYEANESSGAPANITAVSESSAAPANVSATSESSDAPANVYGTNKSSGAPANVSATCESTCAPANVYEANESSGAPAHITAVSESSAAPANFTATNESSAAHANVTATNESSVAPASDTTASETKLPLSKN